MNGRDRTATAAYYRALSRQTVFLARRWHTAAPGLPRFEALTGLIYAGLALTGAWLRRRRLVLFTGGSALCVTILLGTVHAVE